MTIKAFTFAAIVALSASGAAAQSYDGPPYGSGYGPGYPVPMGPESGGFGYGPDFGPGYGSGYGPGFGGGSATQGPGRQGLGMSSPDWRSPAWQGTDRGPRSYPAVRVEPESEPTRLVREGVDKLRAFTGAGAVDEKAALAFAEKELVGYFDFRYMAETALARVWNRLGPPERAETTARLRDMFLARVAGFLGDAKGTRVEVLPSRRGRNRGETVVPVRVERWRARPMDLDFRFYEADDGWKAFDVNADGQSAIAFFRGFFLREIHQEMQKRMQEQMKTQMEQRQKQMVMPQGGAAMPPQGGAAMPPQGGAAMPPQGGAAMPMDDSDYQRRMMQQMQPPVQPAAPAETAPTQG